MENSFVLCDTIAMEIESLGMFIRRQRNGLNLTQKELGAAIGMTDRTVSEWESGRGAPNRDAIDRMARLFRVAAEEFFLRMRPDDPVVEEARKAGEFITHAGDAERDLLRQRAITLIDALLADPQKLDQWLDFGEYLRRGQREAE